jgi:hypothetical protein
MSAYASLCDACRHLMTRHRLRKGGELVPGPYDCRDCDCAIRQDAPSHPLTQSQYERWLRDEAPGAAQPEETQQ